MSDDVLPPGGGRPAGETRVPHASAGRAHGAPGAGPPSGGAPAEPVVTPRRLIAFLALVFGMFMAILDIQIVSSSLAEIQAGLSASPDEISWVQTSYLIAEVIMIPLSGYLGRALSTRVLFSISAAGFTLASVLCATATTLPEMIVYRAIQGFIGGGMIPTAFAAAYTIFPKRHQPAIMALVGLTVTLAPTVGPTIGGYLTELFSWHWLFLINVVPGAAATLIAWTMVDFDEPDLGLLKNFDYVALAALAAFLGSLEYVLEEGARDDWFQDETIRVLTVVSVVGGIAFFWRCFAAKDPLVDLRAYADRNFAVGSLLTFAMGVGLYGMTYLYPVFLGRVRGYDSLQIGETVFVTGMFMFMTAPVVGVLSRKIDPRYLIGAGFLGFGVSCLDLTYITKDWAFWDLFVPQALRGVSLMMCMVPINVVSLATLPQSKLKNASGLFNLMRNLGGAFGLAFINTFLNERQDLHMLRLRENVTWGRAVAEEQLSAMTNAFTARLGSDAELAAVKQMSNMVRQQGLVLAFADLFWALAILFAALVVLVPLVRRPNPNAAAAPAH
ncbi:DHA2 family multidrug resistance protein [Methylopila capsulata]|uniref:DHA2 family multidrug resistance protein n=1 Tax=Methylopila capsulata TaxID=61654 RepID=A0A9W6IS13_9HYPH|nr:DHA2 family efflux MFS transporter permease subunit [Methylopila capsulata]MBM7851251.1 DHA2 family multidrug resistance protein [Methylopila capsulata]GLK54309.1 MFS transporter [Methylopila capsulata]